MIKSKSQQVQEIIKCGKDPNYFFKNYLKIQHPVRGLIPFDTYQFQDDCVDQFKDNRFNIVLKSRQLGLSTLVAAYSVWMAIFQKEKNILIIATKLAVAQNFIIKVKTMIRSLPKWLLLPEIVANNKQMIQFNHGSQIKAIPTSEDAGRSEALSLLIVDEAAFVRNFDTIWTGIYPTISTGGRVIILSTPNGAGGQYYKLYTQAEAGLNEFNAIRLPWDVHPERGDDWFAKTTANMSKRQIAQEFLCDFTTSGDTFLDTDALDLLRKTIVKPIDRAGDDKNVWIWKYPLSEHDYIMSADVARGDAKDYSTFHIIDSQTGEVVCEYKGKIRPDNFAILLNEFGIKYNKALLCPENNSYGYATILKLVELRYPRLYYKKNRKAAYVGNYVPPTTPDQAGFNTNGKTRGTVLAKLEEVLRNKQIISYSSRFFEELKVFTWQSGKAQAKRGFNDDLVMSLAIGSWLYDASSDYSKNSKDLNNAMLASMSVHRKEYDQTPDAALEGMNTIPIFRSKNNESSRNIVKTDLNKALKRSNIPKDMYWVIK
ncbi:MAG: terminase large subunit domain-containing protein [Candidatus Actinomarinaceae bacterium]